MNKNIVEQTLYSIDNIDRLTDLAAISIYNTSHEALDKYDIMQEHATQEYVQEEFIQESVLAGVLIGAGIIGVAVSAFFIIRKIINSGAKGDKSKSKDTTTAAGIDLTKPEEAKKFLAEKQKEIDKWADGTTASLAKSLDPEAAKSIHERVSKFSDLLTSIIEKEDPEGIKQAAEALMQFKNDAQLPQLTTDQPHTIEKNTKLEDLVNMDCVETLAKAYTELEKKIADVEKKISAKTKKEGSEESATAVDAEGQKAIKEICNVFQKGVNDTIVSERGYFELIAKAIAGAKAPAPQPTAPPTAAENKTDIEPKPADGSTEAKDNGNPTAAPADNGSGSSAHVQAHTTKNLQGQMNKSMEKTLNDPNADINFTPPTTGLDAKELNDNMQMPGISSTAVRDKEQLKLSPEEEPKLDEAINSIEPYLRVNMRASDDDIKEFLMKKGYTPTVAIRAVDEYRTRQNLVNRDAEAKAKSMPSLNPDGTSSDDGDEASAANKIAQYINHAPMRNNLQKHLGQSGYSLDSNQLNMFLGYMASRDVKQMFTDFISKGASDNAIKTYYQIFNAIATQIGLTPGERAAIGLNFSVDEFLNSNSDLDQFKFDSIDKVVKANEGAKSEAEIKAILKQQGYTDEDIKKYYDQIKAGGPNPTDIDTDEDKSKLKPNPDPSSLTAKVDAIESDDAELNKICAMVYPKSAVTNPENTRTKVKDMLETIAVYFDEGNQDGVIDEIIKGAVTKCNTDGTQNKKAFVNAYADLYKRYTACAKALGVTLPAAKPEKIDNDERINSYFTKGVDATNAEYDAKEAPTPEPPTEEVKGFDHDYSADNPAPTATHSVPQEILDAHPSADINAVNKNYDAIMNAIDKLNDPKYDPKFDPNPDPEGLMQRINSVPSYSDDTKAAIFDAIKQAHPEINVPTSTSEPTPTPVTEPTEEPQQLKAAFNMPANNAQEALRQRNEAKAQAELNRYASLAAAAKTEVTPQILEGLALEVIDKAKAADRGEDVKGNTANIKSRLKNIYNNIAGPLPFRLGASKEKKDALALARTYLHDRMAAEGVDKYFVEMEEPEITYQNLIMECDIAIAREEKLKLITEQK